jgi:HEAT repeat protein
LNDEDPRVRANAIEVVEKRNDAEYIPMLAQRARSSHNRERANAVKALGKMKLSIAQQALSSMLEDERGDHRISALWALRQIGLWRLLNQVAQMARFDKNLKVRRYALTLIKSIVEEEQSRRNSA